MKSASRLRQTIEEPGLSAWTLPELLMPNGDTVKNEFIRMPDSTGFVPETGLVVPVTFRVRKGGYSRCMFLNDDPSSRGRPGVCYPIDGAEWV
jgi:acetoacetate decarboxylase